MNKITTTKEEEKKLVFREEGKKMRFNHKPHTIIIIIIIEIDVWQSNVVPENFIGCSFFSVFYLEA